MGKITVDQIANAYQEELEKWDFFSDGQRCYIDDQDHIMVCLRNYNWYTTKEPIKDALTAIKAIFEIDWVAEYEEEDGFDWVDGSKYWRKA